MPTRNILHSTRMPLHPFVAGLLIGLSLTAHSEPDFCRQAAQVAEIQESAFYPPATYRVTGSGRLYFHRAPYNECQDSKLFLVAGDRVTAYPAYDGWFSVSYRPPGGPQEINGWLRMERLDYVDGTAPLPARP